MRYLKTLPRFAGNWTMCSTHGDTVEGETHVTSLRSNAIADVGSSPTSREDEWDENLTRVVTISPKAGILSH